MADLIPWWPDFAIFIGCEIAVSAVVSVAIFNLMNRWL